MVPAVNFVHLFEVFCSQLECSAGRWQNGRRGQQARPQSHLLRRLRHRLFSLSSGAAPAGSVHAAARILLPMMHENALKASCRKGGGPRRQRRRMRHRRRMPDRQQSFAACRKGRSFRMDALRRASWMLGGRMERSHGARRSRSCHDAGQGGRNVTERRALSPMRDLLPAGAQGRFCRRRGASLVSGGSSPARVQKKARRLRHLFYGRHMLWRCLRP